MILNFLKKQTCTLGLKKPTTQKQEVLYLLLKYGILSRGDLFNMASVWNSPEIIRRLRKDHDLVIKTHISSKINKFGREIKYGTYELKEPYFARAVYKNLQSIER